MYRKIILLGYMGSGKSTIGLCLSKKINLNFYDLDSFISEKENMLISEIFNQKGEIYFRKKEQLYLQEVLSIPSDLVISLGGGTPCFADNMQKIIQSSPDVFYLKYSAQELTQRLFPNKLARPLIAHLSNQEFLEEFIHKHLFDRNPFYLQAHHIINADAMSQEQILEQIVKISFKK